MTIDTATMLGLALKDDEVARLRALPYKEYLKSDWWHWKRDQAGKRAGWECELCGSAYDWPEIHHTTYERIGCERPDDLIALCWECHKHLHRNGLDKLSRRDLLRRRSELLYSPEFGWAWGKF